MECMLQWLDDLDDLCSTLVYAAERAMPFILGMLFLVTCVGLTAAGILLAVRQPPLALALATALTVALLYRGSMSEDDRYARG